MEICSKYGVHMHNNFQQRQNIEKMVNEFFLAETLMVKYGRDEFQTSKQAEKEPSKGEETHKRKSVFSFKHYQITPVGFSIKTLHSLPGSELHGSRI